MRFPARSLAFLSAAVLVIACGAGDDSAPPPLGANDNTQAGGPGNGPIVIGPDGVPVGPDGKPLAPKLEGRYELSNTFDLTSTGVFPEPAADTLKALSNFREHPSQTLVDLLDAANVPVVPTVLNAIPAVIRGYVLGWIDDHVFKAIYEKVPVTQQITGMLDDLASITTKFELVSALDLPKGDEIGNSRATHVLTGVAYNWSEQRHVIAAPELVRQLETVPVDANAVALEKLSPKLEAGRLKLGLHQFKIPIGSFALVAADTLAKEKFGAANLRDAIGKVVDCKAVAADVANRCIDPFGPGKVCVGHQSDLENLCKVGLDVLVGVVQGQIKRLDLPGLNMKSGQAQMWDAPAENGPLDAVIDRIDNGFWTATVNVGKDEKKILATFTGRRIGEVGGGATTK
jgi:hypothetical protein